MLPDQSEEVDDDKDEWEDNQLTVLLIVIIMLIMMFKNAVQKLCVLFMTFDVQ